jgi:MFS family permease
MIDVERTDTWRALYVNGLLGRFIVLCLGIWLHAVDTLVTATISPAIVADIGGVAFINWTIALYQVGAIAAGAAAPMLCRRIGVKQLLIIAAVVYGAGCIVAAIAPRMSVLQVGRLAQGIGGGLLLSLCYIAIQEWFDQSWWSRLFGVVALIWGAGSLLGPLFGGIFAGLHSWRMTFFALALQAAVLWLLAALWLPTQPRTSSRAPSPPAASSAPRWSVLPLLTLTAATLIISASGLVRSLLAAIAGALLGTGLLYLAARLDRGATSRMFPVQLLQFRHPVGAGLMMIFALSVATTGFWAYGPLILQTLFGTQPLASGYMLAGEAVAWSAGTMAVANAPESAGRALIRWGAAAVALGAAGFAIAVPAGALAAIAVCALLQGLGFGLCWPSIVHRMARFSDAAERPLAVTSPETMQRIGYAVGAAAVGIAGNLAGLAQGISIAAVKAAAFWVFAAFVPILIVGVIYAWIFTREPAVPV